MKNRTRVRGIDFDPDAVHLWRAKGYDVIYGDAEDAELVATLLLHPVKPIIGTMPSAVVSRALLQGLRGHGFTRPVVVTAHGDQERRSLLSEGASLVLMPFEDASSEAADKLESLCNI